MSLKSRIERLEEQAGTADPLIVFFKTFIEGKDGTTEFEIWRASIASGPAAGTFVDRYGDESFEQFQSRAYQISRGLNESNTLKDSEGVARKNVPLSPVTNLRKPLEANVQQPIETIEQKE